MRVAMPKEAKEPKPPKPQKEPKEAKEAKDKAPKEKAPKAPPEKIRSRLYLRYHDEIVPKLMEKFGRKNKLSLPRLQKVVVNMGVGKALQDKNRLEQSAE